LKKFFLNSVVSVTFFSLIKFSLNLKIASLLLPSDYGVILLPLIIFSFLDLLLEGGLHSGIIKYNASKNDLLHILKNKLRLWILFGPLIAVFLIFLDILSEIKIPALITFLYLIASLFKLSNYFSEAKLIAEGKYIHTEFLNFLVTILTYGLVILLIPYFEISGFYFLAMLNIMLISVYGILLNISLRNYINNQSHSSLRELKIFADSVLQSNYIFVIGARVDELCASILINANALGIYTKAKELGTMLGTFSSKIVSRPWYYIACKLQPKNTSNIYFLSMLCLALTSILLLPFLLYLLSLVISFLGPNWTKLTDFSIFMALIFLLYFFVQFSNSTLLALGFEREQLIIDRVIIGLKIAVYLLLLLVLLLQVFSLKIELFFYIEILFRAINLLLQICLMIWKRYDLEIKSTN
tara:strand:- start:10092 stop:11327 length:1236 start_codon:yes stop_codon:yes gene_type:complete